MPFKDSNEHLLYLDQYNLKRCCFISLSAPIFFRKDNITNQYQILPHIHTSITKGTSNQVVLCPICLSWWEMWESLAEIINFIAVFHKVVFGLFISLHINTWENEPAEDIKFESKLCLPSPSKYNSWFRTDLYDSWSNIFLGWNLMFVAI